MTTPIRTSTTPLGRLLLLACLVSLGVLSTGCKSQSTAAQVAEDRERKTWSAEYSWAEIKRQQNPSALQTGLGWVANQVSPGLEDVVESADDDFTSQLDIASSSQLPPNGVAGLLESIRPKVAQAIQAEGQHLQGNGVGLILLGDLTGPDGRPLSTTSQGAVEIERFMGDLLASEGLDGRWYYKSMTPEQAERAFQQGSAIGGNATQDNGRTYVYNRENLLVLNLAISATPNATDHRVDYHGVGSIATPVSGTSSTIEGARVQYFYQPFMGDWITGDVERARRLTDPTD